ncbi:hypothetical protein BLA29_000720, partial [Euroglyphus maynei]
MEPNQQQTVVDDEYSTGEQTINNLFNLSTRVLRTRNLETSKPPPNVEEQIIRKRGRRHWEKLIPKTPPKRAVKRSLDYNDNNSSVTAITSPGPKPNESPFTKCLRGLMSPIPKVNSEELQPSSGIISRVLRSSDSHKSFYYSPHPPYNLRSKDLNRTSINNDSGIGLTPELYIGKDTPS